MNKTIIVALATGLVGALLLADPAFGNKPVKKIKLSDPAGDDKGPGTYTYPTDPAYTPGAFDLKSLEVVDKGKTVEFRVGIRSRITDPWNSKDWPEGGYGFSLQFVQIYIDTDHKAGSGYTKALPGLAGVKFAADQAWDRVVLISPHGKGKLKPELNAKARKMAKSAVIPRTVRVRGRKLVAVVAKSALGPVHAGWGIQAVMQSAEGYPVGRDILTRPVNETGGPHRFGGGHDTKCDPHVLDIFAGKAAGAAAEVKAQQAALAYKCGKKVATLPMIYPFAR